MNGGRISVIVPCYNVEQYIQNTVDSILAQSYKTLDVILVDDGSTDRTKEIIDRLANVHSRVRSFHKENGGVSSARLYGIDQAVGDWITFADADDLLKQEMYSVLISNAIKYKADISHCGYEMVFPDHIDSYYGTGKIVLQKGKEGIKDLLTGNFVEPSLCNKIYRREIVLDARKECGRALKIHYLEDLLWNYYFFKRSGRSIFVGDCYYQYILRRGSASQSQDTYQKVMDPIKVFRLIEQDIFRSNESGTLQTQGLVNVIRSRKAAALVNIASLDTKKMPDWASECSSRARSFLLKNLRHYMLGPYSTRLKIKALSASVSPGTYNRIHGIYRKLRGTDHKYEI